MTNSIGIIGMGWVGSSVAISVLNLGLCRNLLLNDARPGIAEGEAMDLNHGSSFFPSADVRAARIEEMHGCAAIAISAGRGGKPGETRLDLLRENIEIAKDISARLKGYEGILIIVSNPVDVLTYYYQKYTGLPAGRVIGTGTFLDTVRLRESISSKLGIEPKGIHAFVIGEHGDSEVVLWSKATAGGQNIREWPNWQASYEHEIAEEVRTAAYEIIKRKGCTNHAIGLVTATLLKWILRGGRRVVTLSTVINGPFGLSDVAISLPSLISENGVESIMPIHITDYEQEGLLKSAAVIRDAIDSVR